MCSFYRAFNIHKNGKNKIKFCVTKFRISRFLSMYVTVSMYELFVRAQPFKPALHPRKELRKQEVIAAKPHTSHTVIHIKLISMQ